MSDNAVVDSTTEPVNAESSQTNDQPMSAEDAAAAAASLSTFMDAVDDSPRGAMSKAELEFLIFELLIRQGRVNLEKSDTALSTQLRTTPTRIRALRFKHEQRNGAALDATALLKNMRAFNAEHDDRVLVTIDSVYLLGLLVDEIRSRHFLVQRELTGGMIRVSLLDLVQTLAEMGVLHDAKSQDLLERLNDIRAEQRGKETKDTLKVSAAGISDAAQAASAGTTIIDALAKFLAG
jgi:hypothetical protein